MARRSPSSGIPAPLLLMLSSGGLTHVAEAQRAPGADARVGPGRRRARRRLLRRGATAAATCSPSTWAAPPPSSALVDGGEPLTAYSFEAARQQRFIEGSGLPIRISTIELIEIGAGGGSIARGRRDRPAQGRPAQRGLAAGPRLLRPGRHGADGDRRRLPARLSQSRLLRRRHDGASTCAAARAALERLARAAAAARVTEVAWGIHDIVNENMAGAARVHIAERGRDPRDYALLCTGGAGPVHACYGRAQARPRPGDLSAVGRRGLGARPAGGAGPRGPRGHGRASGSTGTASARSRRRSAGSRTRRAR